MLGMHALADIDKLSEWIDKSKLDPNDPSNADLMFLMKVSQTLPDADLSQISKYHIRAAKTL